MEISAILDRIDGGPKAFAGPRFRMEPEVFEFRQPAKMATTRSSRPTPRGR